MTRWYRDGLRFECTQCGRCCGGAPGTVWISLKDIVNIAGFLNLGTQEFGRKYLRLVDNQLSLIEKPDYDCIFLENNQCIIYPVRPIQCRLYPFWRELLESEENWKLGTAMCRGVGCGKEHSADEIENLLEGQK